MLIRIRRAAFFISTLILAATLSDMPAFAQGLTNMNALYPEAPCIPPGPPPPVSLVTPANGSVVPLGLREFIVQIGDRYSIGDLQLLPNSDNGISVNAPLLPRAFDADPKVQRYSAFVPWLSPHTQYRAILDIIEYPGKCQKGFTIDIGGFTTM